MQGLSAVVLDGINLLSETKQSSLNTQLKLEWIGEVIQNYEQRYIAYEHALSTLAGFYNAHGFKMMILKGYACSLDWPIPNHRPCGDIDIWQFGQQKEADAALEASFEIQNPSLKMIIAITIIRYLIGRVFLLRIITIFLMCITISRMLRWN